MIAGMERRAIGEAELCGSGARERTCVGMVAIAARLQRAFTVLLSQKSRKTETMTETRKNCVEATNAE